MSLKSSSDQYGTIAVTIHWLSALLIFALIGSGFRASNMENLTSKADILKIHASFGIAILTLTLARILWWKFAEENKPKPIQIPKLQDRAAHTVHVFLYIVILGMSASGIGMMVISGAASIIFGASADTLPNFWDYKPRIPHGIGARFMIALFVLHASAALYHHFVKKDGLLKRMWYKKILRD